MTTWLIWLADRWRRLGPAVGVCTALGLAAGAARLAAGTNALAAWDLALRAGAGAWIAWALFTTLSECLTPPSTTRSDAESATRDPRAAWRVLCGAAALLAVALARSPARLAVNLLGFALVGPALIWLVRRRAGSGPATRAGIAFALLALFPTHLDLPRPPERTVGVSGSAFRWTSGWPTDDWRLRHDISLDTPLSTDVLQLWVQHDRGGEPRPGRIGVSVNGIPVGELAPRGVDWYAVDLPAAALSGQSELRFELWQVVPDRGQRLIAQRWAGGATLGSAASSYFDGRDWHSGTFDDALGAASPGIYVIELRGRLWR